MNIDYLITFTITIPSATNTKYDQTQTNDAYIDTLIYNPSLIFFADKKSNGKFNDVFNEEHSIPDTYHINPFSLKGA